MAAGMLNPSDADEEVLDRTVSNQINRANAMGLGSLVVFNAYALVTPYPAVLKARAAAGFDIVGPDNDAHTRAIMISVRDQGGLVTVGWGKDGEIGGRDLIICKMAADLGIELHSLGKTMNGQPRHPRGVPKTQSYVPWCQRV